MNISATSAVFSRVHPKLNLVFLHVKKIDNSKAQESAHLLHEVAKVIQMTFQKETVKNHMLLAPWSVAQQEFGKDARHYQTSVEHFTKDVLHGKDLTTKTAITNITRYISLKYLIPLAVDDCAKINGDIQFDVLAGNKRAGFFRSLKKGDVYYCDTAQLLGAKLDYWRNPKTLPSPETTEALIHLDLLPPVTKELQRKIVDELTSLIETFCSGKVAVYTLNRVKKRVNFK